MKNELEKLKAKKKRSYLSDYNKFMRSQIKSGKTFKQAVALWKKKKKDDERKSKVQKEQLIIFSFLPSLSREKQ